MKNLFFDRIVSLFMAISLLIFGQLPQNVFAHGTVTTPPSRVWQCRQENPENPSSAACRAAIAVSGSQGIYDWNSIRQGKADDNHQQAIADGKLCSGGNTSHAGLDLARDDWFSTLVTTGPSIFNWTNSAPHATKYYRYFITKNSYEPNHSLNWSDLELFCESGPSAAKKTATHSCWLPDRRGKHVIYSIWQRSDSPEAFYACVDLDFGQQ